MELDTREFKRTMGNIWTREYAKTLPLDTEYNSVVGYKFIKYLLDSYGVEVSVNRLVDNRLDIAGVRVIDARKYMILQLKFA